MTLAGDAGMLLFQLGISLQSLAHFWPLGESPVPMRGMLRLTFLVTAAVTPAAVLHSVLGVNTLKLKGPLCDCKYASCVQCMFLCISAMVSAETPSVMNKECLRNCDPKTFIRLL